MADFHKMAEAMATKNNIDTDAQLNDIKNQKDSIMQFFNIKIAELELQKNEQKAVEQGIKTQQKENKLKQDLISEYMKSEQAQGPMAIGDDMVGQLAGTQIAPDAEGLPVLDGIA
jgi:hypothetical protein